MMTKKNPKALFRFVRQLRLRRRCGRLCRLRIRVTPATQIVVTETATIYLHAAGVQSSVHRDADRANVSVG